MKHIGVFLDGTWNDPSDTTNVFSLNQKLLTPITVENIEQVCFYGVGVGVPTGTKVRGGAFGFGLSENLLAAYDWLVKAYDPGDKIFIMGFSRGAYTARSLAGFIARCGLLVKGSSLASSSLYERYELGKDAVRLDELMHIKRHNSRSLTPAELALLDQSRRVEIEMLGVWDTVGALGVPWTASPLFGPKNYYFHNTNPSSLYKNCFQALALDEHRGAYAPTLWTDFVPQESGINSYKRRDPARFEQRWFIGAHANVGGGYANDPLRNLPLDWMQRKAEALGLEFSGPVIKDGKELDTKPTDSFSQFMNGLYKLAKFGKRFYRPVGAGPKQVSKGWSIPINEVIDASVFARFSLHDDYRPKNLISWAERSDVSLGGLQGDRAL